MLVLPGVAIASPFRLPRFEGGTAFAELIMTMTKNKIGPLERFGIVNLDAPEMVAGSTREKADSAGFAGRFIHAQTCEHC